MRNECTDLDYLPHIWSGEILPTSIMNEFANNVSTLDW